ncbi:hypothetical protein [Mesoflavibacter sp. SCSIO 43206]|uniref:hypothetical protein n=1 Tax=Mesoflavibacter sp. SCSIO 43206 TaxID=2779362 RepID=UPI001CA84B9A|nr:hypothetical protein [Mesoflavibacter sp. SCSIO 43206]UAB74359.1 hypothetical protein INR78_08095 [Mesoflavibacter sp. SCSIO 43206]
MKTLIILFTLTLVFILIWHFQFIKKEKQRHNYIINSLNTNLNFENEKSTKLIFDKDYNYKLLNFKLNIIKEQVDLLKEISN